MPSLRRLCATVLFASLGFAGCTGGPVGLDTSSPTSMSANPSAITVEETKSADVDIQFKNVNNQVLSSTTWLPQCSLTISDAGVATATVVNGKLRITGLNPGNATVTVVSSQHVTTTIQVTVTSPTPVITNVISLLEKGNAGFIFITATGLTSSATVLINGAVRTATLVTPTQLEVRYTKEETYDLTPGPLTVAVFNGPNGAQSDVRQLQVVYPPPPRPTLSQNGVIQGYADDLVLTVHTTDPASDSYNAFGTSRVRFDGVELPTTFVDRNTLRVTVPKANFQVAGTHAVTVVNPQPGGGVSDPEPFTVSPAPFATATFDFTNYEQQVVWAAQSQNGGAFAQVPVVQKKAEFPVTGNQVQFAMVSQVGSAVRGAGATGAPANLVLYLLTVFGMTGAEATATVHRLGFPFGATGLSGTVSGLGAGETGQLLWGNSEAFTNAAQPAFAMNNSTPGPHRLVGYRRSAASPSTGDRVFARAVQASASGISVDFLGAESAPVASATASLAGLIAGDQAFASVGYITEPTCEGTLWYSTPASSSFLITGIPGALQGSSDVHLVRTVITNGSHTLQQTFYNKALIGFAATRPAPAAVPTVSTVSTTPYLIRQALVNLGSYEAGTFFYSTVSITVTKGYLGGATGTVRMSDLSGVTGWNPAWGPPASPAWTFGANSYTSVMPPCGDGTSITTVSVSGSTP